MHVDKIPVLCIMVAQNRAPLPSSTTSSMFNCSLSEGLLSEGIDFSFHLLPVLQTEQGDRVVKAEMIDSM